MQRTQRSIDAEQKFRDAVDEFNRKNNRHIEIIGDYQNTHTPIELHEKTVINGKTYENSWAQIPESFERGHEGNPLFNTGQAGFIMAVDDFNRKNNRHIEIVGDYTNVNTPVELHEKSVINGKTYEERWLQTPARFEQGYEGNPLFAKRGMWSQDRWDMEFRKACKKHFPGRKIEYWSEYTGNTAQITLHEETEKYGKMHDVTWTERPDHFLEGHESNPLLTMTGNWTQQRWDIEFEHAKEIYFPGRDIKCLDEYTNNKIRMRFSERTELYGTVYNVTWRQRPNNFIRGFESNPLLKKSGANYTQQRWEIEFKHAKEIYFHGRDIRCHDEYKDSRILMKFTEKTEKYGQIYEAEWVQTPRDFINGEEGNPLLKKAGGNYTQQRWEIEFEHIKKICYPGRDIKCLSDYIDNKTELEFSEPVTFPDGRMQDVHWWRTPRDFFQGYSGNPYEKKKGGTSFIQEFLYSVLSQYFVPKGYSVSNRDRSLFENYDGSPLELDIVIYDKNNEPKMALEPGAWYHHQERVQHDIDKLSICNENDLFCLLLYFGCKKDCDQVFETESIKNYKAENPNAQDHILVYSKPVLSPKCQKDRDNLTDLIDAIGHIMNVENLSEQPEISIDDAIDYANIITSRSDITTDEISKEKGSFHRQIPEKFEEMLKATDNKNEDMFEK